MLEARNISVVFRDQKVLDNVSFIAEQGEKICLFGPSGGGKTTALNALMGIADLDKGAIFMDGIELSPGTVHEFRKNIAWLPQNINLPVQNGEELLNYYLQQKVSVEAESLLNKFGLDKDILRRNINEISGGQKQRMILSTILMLNRPYLLLDEPTSALDDESVKKIIEVIFSIQDITVISTSHNPIWIERCDRTYKIQP